MALKNISLSNKSFNNYPLSSAISIDDDFKSIRFFHADKKSKSFSVKTEFYKGKPFDENFYETFKGILSLHQKEYSDKVALILPDTLFFTDTIKLPFIQKSALQSSLNLALDALYNNKNDIKFNSFILSQNKQHAIYNVCGIRKEVLTKILNCFDDSGIHVAEVTFAANAAKNAAVTINPKLKNANFILLDVKDNFSRFSFVIGGKTVGFYSLPFGYDALKTDSVVSELSLFDHTAADLLVLNAQEKARKKQLTMLGEDSDSETLPDALEQENDFDGDDELLTKSDAEDDTSSAPVKSGALFKRVNKKLPKFMQRPEPQSEQEFINENFRVFVKWALELIRNNNEIFSLGAPDSVVVNIPDKFSTVFPVQDLNANVNFTPLCNGENADVTANLELFGGLFTKKFNKVNNF